MKDLSTERAWIPVSATDASELLGVPISVLQHWSRSGVGLQPRLGPGLAPDPAPAYDLASILGLLSERVDPRVESA